MWCEIYLKSTGKSNAFQILSSFSHNLTRKLIFSQKEWVKHQIWFAFFFDAFKCCFWWFQITLLKLYYTVKASKVLKFERQFNLVGVKLSRYPCSIVHSYFCSLHLRHVFLEPHNTPLPPPLHSSGLLICYVYLNFLFPPISTRKFNIIKLLSNLLFFKIFFLKC